MSPRRSPSRRQPGAPRRPVAGRGSALDPTLRLMTLNIMHGRQRAQLKRRVDRAVVRRNLERIAGVLAREGPDVVALQEADGPSAWSGRFDHVATLAELAGFPHAFRGEHNPVPLRLLDLSYGTALLSRLPLRAARSHAFQQSWRDSKGFVAAHVVGELFGGDPVEVVSIHLDFLAERVRRRQVDQLIDRFRAHQGHLVLMGDFNCAWSERRRCLDRLRLELRLRPSHGGASPTFPAWRPLVRLDWILISEGLEFAAYETLGDQVSDHLGVVAEVRRRGALAPVAQARRLPSVSLA